MRIDIYNVMERVVKDALSDVTKSRDGFCKCEECQVDIMAVALNQLPPKYVATRKGEVFSKLTSLSNQFNSDAYTAVVKAIEIVNRQPHHNQNE